MSSEEKILTLLEKMQEELISIKDAQSVLDKRMDGLHESLFTAKTDIMNIKTSLFTIKDDLQSVKLRLELDVERRFDAVNASIDTVEKHLDTLDEMKELAGERKGGHDPRRGCAAWLGYCRAEKSTIKTAPGATNTGSGKRDYKLWRDCSPFYCNAHFPKLQ